VHSFVRIVLAALACLTLAARAHGQPGAVVPKLPAVVRIADPGDQELLERVRGQTNDLDVRLIAESGAPLESGLGEQLEAARRLAAQHDARVVVWFVREDRALTVFVSEPAAGRVLVRRLERSADQLASSAQHEAAALVVRSAMRALAQGGEIGVAEKEVAPPPPAPLPPPPPPPEPPPPAPLPPPVEQWEVVQHVGGRAALDGTSWRGQYSLVGRIVARYGSFQAELRGAYGFPERVDDPMAHALLVRHGVTLHGAYLPYVSHRWILSTAVGGGLNIFRSEVEGRGSGFDAEDRALVVSSFAADVGARYLPGWGGGRFGFSAWLGAELLPLAPTLGYYDQAMEFVVLDHVWHVLPALALEIWVKLR
jgi:hypothetical protein